MTAQVDTCVPAPVPAHGGRHVESRVRRRLRRTAPVLAVAGLVAWSLHRALPPGGEIVNHGGVRLLGTILAEAVRPATDPAFLQVVAEAAVTTLALALLGTVAALALGLLGGLVLADITWGDRLPWPVRLARLLLRGWFVAVRSVHELVWALLFVGVLGFDPLVAVLALALPFAAQAAQVFGETFDATPRQPLRALQRAGVRTPVALVYALLPASASLLLSYSFYRFECALRSTVVLGIAGVGGLGFEMAVSLQSRNWDEVWTLVAAILLLAAAVELWSVRVRADLAVVTCSDWSSGQERLVAGRRPPGLRRTTKASLLLIAPGTVAAWWWVGLDPSALWAPRSLAATDRLLGDLWPPELPVGGWPVLVEASLDTLAMAVLAMAVAVAVTLSVGPWASRPRADRRGATGWGRLASWALARLVLLVLRSVPPTVWAVIALFALFPGVLPGALALGVYTAGVLGRLAAEAWETIDLAPRDALRRAGVPRVAAAAVSLGPPSAHHLLTYTVNRFEICVRDTAIVGVVGAAGLGRVLAEGLASVAYPVVATVLLASLTVSVVVETLSRRLGRSLRG